MKSGDSILVVLSGALGDLIRGLSISCAIKSANDDVRIAWLVDSTWMPIVEAHPAVDEAIVFDRKAPVKHLPSLVKKLRSTSFTLTLDMQRHLKSGLCSWFSGSPRRVGFHPRNCKEGNQFFNNEFIAEQNDSQSKLLHYLAFLDAIDCPRPENVDFGLSKVGLGLAEGLLPTSDKSRVGIILSSSWATKDWPLSGYQALLNLLAGTEDVEVVLLGTKKDRSNADQLVATAGPVGVVNLAGETSLLQLIDVMRRCTCFVGPDSGPGHIAGALGLPYISLFGPTPPERVAPFGSEKLVIRSNVPCSPCSRKVCPGLDTVCMRLISADQVYQRLQMVLAG